MSEKARDGQGRWRSNTIAFRISPEENDLLEEFVRLSGLTKQEYIISRVLGRQITVVPNPRVHKALRDKMEQVCIQLGQVSNVKDISSETLAVLQMTTEVYNGLKATEK